MTNQNIIVYDLETQKIFSEVTGPNKQAQLGVSFLGLYSYSQNKFFSFFEQDLPKLELILLKERPTIIGFNSISFDNQVLQPYFKQLQINTLPQIDILAEIHATLGFRIKLESVAQATLGIGKSGTGLDAIRYYREGNFAALANYCLDDVRITRDLYNYGRNHGFILYTSGGATQRLPVAWAAEETISKQLQQAYTKHQRIQITYLPNITATIDILDLTEHTLNAFCYNSNNQQRYNIEQILALEFTGEQYAYQASLL